MVEIGKNQREEEENGREKHRIIVRNNFTGSSSKTAYLEMD
jgi:hypothetical protein